MTYAAALDMLLHERRIGMLARLDGDCSIFMIHEDYLADKDRATLSLAYRAPYGSIVNAPLASQTKIEPYFSNLLSEGTLRDYLARRVGLIVIREIPPLGGNLLGAVKAVPVNARDAHP